MSESRGTALPSATPQARGGYSGIYLCSNVVISGGELIVTSREIRVEAGRVMAVTEKGTQRVTL